MSQFKKGLALLLVIALTAALSVSLTMAYLQDTDEDVNVMTLGNVEIEQIEQERGANGVLQNFTQDKPAYPVVGPIEWADNGVDVNGTEYKVFTDELKNVVDKIVTVKNKGKSDAYVRTIIAIEAPEGNPNDLIHYNYNGDAGLNWSPLAKVTIDGVDYVYTVATYLAALKPGEISAPSLVQVFLDSRATNVDVAKFGDTWEIFAISQAVQTKGFDNAATALDTAFGKVDGNIAAWVEETIEAAKADTWDGTADTSWYNDTDTEFVITTAEQLAGLAELVDGGNNFAGKTVKVGKNLDLYHLADGATDPTCFDPIGSYRKDLIFEGTFDGQNYTIANMNQNTWALDNGYYYGDLGLGLFGAVENATIKNLVMDNASISGESALCGTIAAVAGENVTFENITVKNSKVADYQYYAGGIVGWAGGDAQFINCVIDASTTIGAQWGEFNNANGGVIGGVSTSAAILMKDCTVACRIDGFNDVTSAYEWYSYRRSGMLIGDSGQKDDPDGDNVGNAIAPNLTCENVTVIYGDWANYHYCQFKNMAYPWVRVEAGTSTDAYSNARYGHPTDANGNKVVDENHVHNDGEKHHELIVFDQLYGGASGHRYCTYGTATHDGVTVVYNNR